MNKFFQSTLLVSMLFALSFTLNAKEMVGVGNAGSNGGSSAGKTAADCNPASSFTELNINNVRAGLLNGGDLWWNLDAARYEVPKVDPESGEVSRHSIFAGALWIGGIDNLGQLKVAAQTYRQTGNDFFPGPLDATGNVEESTCSSFDRFFEVKGADIDLFVAAWEESGGTAVAASEIPASILNWPGKDNPYFTDFQLPQGEDLAPYFESGISPGYDPTTGDYPVIDPENAKGVYADQMIWWIFNDKGNIHSESGGEAIGLEIKALAFAFATNDCINDMTFYRYVIENTSTAVLDSVYFGQWVDPDLGAFDDDFVGCVVEESLGIVYNGDANDQGSLGYGQDIPMLGVDFFEGPKADLDGDGIKEQLGMSAFVYYNNDFTPQGNPETADHFYGYMAGVWKDKSPFTFGGNAFQTGGEETNYMFPSDPTLTAGDGIWSECSEGNTPADRRFLQVSGPFQLEPGAVNNVIVGAVWVRDGVQHPCPSFGPIVECDKKAQALFDNGFETLRGPDAPSMVVRELDQELILSLFNQKGLSNNHVEFNEDYREVDPILRTQGIADSVYSFQGYRIYQLRSSTVSPAEYGDIDVAREIFTVDIAKDGVTTLVNWEANSLLGVDVPSVQVMGDDQGIKHTFRILEDQFALGDKKLINHKAYYFSALAYGYNNFAEYDPLVPDAGQGFPYIAGAKNIQVYTAIPHIPTPQFGGVTLNSAYGDGPEITQVSGEGNGCLELELTDASIATILENNSIDQPTYKGGFGPVDVKVYDPTLVPNESFTLKLENKALEIFEQPMYGTVTVNGDGTINYIPGPNFPGYDYFIYQVTDANGLADIGVVSFIEDPGSLGGAIVAIPQTEYSDIDFDEEIEIFVDPNAWVGTANPATDEPLRIVSPPFNGTVEVNGTDDGFIYSQNEGHTGLDWFEYEIKNAIPTMPAARATVYVFTEQASRDPKVTDDTGLSVGNGINILDNDEILCDLATLTVCEGDEIDGDVLSNLSTWTLTSSSGKVYRSRSSIILADEIAIGGWVYDGDDIPLGFTVTVKQVPRPFMSDPMLDISYEFEDPQNQWLTGIQDQDGDTRPDNWVLSGATGAELVDYPYDVSEHFENFGAGGVAPYCLTSNEELFINMGFTVPMAPACSDCGAVPPTPSTRPVNTINRLHSVDLVITPNQELWTRCPVVSIGREETNLGETKNNLRRSKSRDRNGNVIDAERGRSYFPGYAINLETGERMNLMFAENFRMSAENGSDMLWNPTELRGTVAQGEGINGFRMGGEHYVYIMDSKYDQGNFYHSLLSDEDNPDFDDIKQQVYQDALWVFAPLLAEGFSPEEVYSEVSEGLVPTEVRIRIRVSLPYKETATDVNPEYTFNMGGFAPAVNDTEVAARAVDLVQVVPNPYYAFSQYENSKFDNKVKITNLPNKANVNIFTLDGTWIKTLSLDNTGLQKGTSLSTVEGTVENVIEWDLKNWRNVPVSSGMYLIHVEAPDLGEEKILKWFGAMRPIDLDTF